MERIREICSHYGVLLIHDEVMTGGGRTGRFFAGEHWNVAPDILVISKGFAAGYAPLGAMVAHRDIVARVLDAGGFLHGFTYAGNPLACAAGLAVLEEIEREHLCRNAAGIGAYLKSELTGLMDRYPVIGDVRGEGLLLAFELVEDSATMRPLPRDLNVFSLLVDIAYDNGLIIYSRRTRGGYSGDHFLVAPPMISTRSHVAEIIDGLDTSLRELLDRISQKRRQAG
jgi:adenosylmethionine-8-amino-7-oxononanoate aminotransferase